MDYLDEFTTLFEFLRDTYGFNRFEYDNRVDACSFLRIFKSKAREVNIRKVNDRYFCTVFHYTGNRPGEKIRVFGDWISPEWIQDSLTIIERKLGLDLISDKTLVTYRADPKVKSLIKKEGSLNYPAAEFKKVN